MMAGARRLWLVACIAALACRAETGADRTVVIASGGDGDVLVPRLWTETQARLYTDLIFDKLAEIGAAQNTVGDAGYLPRLAQSWEWSHDSTAVTFHLDPRARWHDGVPVRAADVRIAWEIYNDPASGANAVDFTALIDSLTTPDSLTATFWYRARRPEMFHAIAYNVVPLPEHLLRGIPHDSLRQSAFAQHPVGDGPFRFVSWDKKVRFELAANDAYFLGRPRIDRLVFSIFADGSAAARAVFAGDADFIEVVTVDDAAEAVRHPEVRLVPARRYEYGFLEFNLRGADGRSPHPILGSRGVRRALTMAVNRAQVVRTVYDTLALVAFGPFTRAQWAADTAITPLPYDTAAAGGALDSLGWRRNAAGGRARNGRRLSLSVLVSTSSRPRVRMAELLQQAMREVGVEVKIDAVDPLAFRSRLAAHQFDAALFAWNTTPSPTGLRQSWTAASFKPGSPFNAGGYASPAFDLQVDSGLAAFDIASARAHLKRAFQAAIDDPPAIWLYEPRLPAAANRRLVIGTMPPDAWWQSIRDWNVIGPAGKRAAEPPR
ncbi:MAG: peptide ABC transporter substrate-binding protein [Gemmatimonadaceae bacterium]|nr:peptide ABC transporter substrate-binding protein [Gemmatimonadaceae bacterium]